MKIKTKKNNKRLSKVNCQRSIVPQQGIAALLIVVILASSALIMAYSASMLGLGELDMGFTSQKGAESFSIADGCMEETLRRIRLDSNYSGEALTVSNGSCIINVTPSGSDRTILVNASTTDGYYKAVETNITLSADAIPVITINSWEEK